MERLATQITPKAQITDVLLAVVFEARIVQGAIDREIAKLNSSSPEELREAISFRDMILQQYPLDEAIRRGLC